MTLVNGQNIDADLVLLAAGVTPNTELATQAGLVVANGIVTDNRLLTSDLAISALGDCAAFPDPATGRSIRLESVQAAKDNARLIAKHLTGKDDVSYGAVPWFWSDQADYKLQIAGLASVEDGTIVRTDGAIFRFAGDRLSAVKTINNPKTHMQARKRLSGPEVSRADLQRVDLELAEL